MNLSRKLAVLAVGVAVALCSEAASAEEASFGPTKEILLGILDGECSGKPSPVSDARAREMLTKLETEELTLAEAHELTQLGSSFFCGLDSDARLAAEAFIREMAVRELDPVAVMRREEALVTPVILPTEWASLMQAAGHDAEKGSTGDARAEKTVPLVLGCVAVLGYVGGATACALDVSDVQLACETHLVCPQGKRADRACCEQKAERDYLNCAITGGVNGPDNDYQYCCA